MVEISKLIPLGEKKTLPRRLLLIGGVILGAGLLVMGNVNSPETAEQEVQSTAAADSIEVYTRELEEKIRLFCEQVEGVSHVSVAVSLDSGYRRVYARDDESYILVGSGASRDTVYLTDQTPVIGGIGIVCRGGGDPAVQQKLIGLLSAAYGVGANKIYIAEAQK